MDAAGAAVAAHWPVVLCNYGRETAILSGSWGAAQILGVMDPHRNVTDHSLGHVSFVISTMLVGYWKDNQCMKMCCIYS